jgi:hypothetical protein
MPLLRRTRDAYGNLSPSRQRLMTLGVALLGAGLVVIVALGSTMVLSRLGFLGSQTMESTTSAIEVTESSAATSGEWQSLTDNGDAFYRWEGSQLRLSWRGSCETGQIEVTVGPQNWGYLSKVMSDSASIGGVAAAQFCADYGSSISTSPVNSWLCYRFTEVWVRIIGDSPDASLFRIAIPESIEPRFCPAGANRNDPSALWWETVEAGLVPEFEGRIAYPVGGSPAASLTEDGEPAPSPAAAPVAPIPTVTVTVTARAAARGGGTTTTTATATTRVSTTTTTTTTLSPSARVTATATATVPGPTTTVTTPVPGPTITVTTTIPVPGPTETVTVTETFTPGS